MKKTPDTTPQPAFLCRRLLNNVVLLHLVLGRATVPWREGKPAAVANESVESPFAIVMAYVKTNELVPNAAPVKITNTNGV